MYAEWCGFILMSTSTLCISVGVPACSARPFVLNLLLLLVCLCVLWLYIDVLVILSSVRPFVWYSVCLSVCMSVCMYVHMYLCRDERTSICAVDIKFELTWLIPCLVWVFTGHSFQFFFRFAVQTPALTVCAPFYAKNVFTIAKKVHISLWAITLYYSTSRLWQWRKVNPKPVSWYLKLCTKTYYDLTVGPPCLIEHELYVENADWIFIRFPHGNVHLMSVSFPGVVVLWYFHTYVGSGHFFGLKILNFNIFGGFQKNEYIFWYENFVEIFGVITKLDYN